MAAPPFGATTTNTKSKIKLRSINSETNVETVDFILKTYPPQNMFFNLPFFFELCNMKTKQDIELAKRYRGHISLCEIDLPGQEALTQSKVLIVGAGGLGSPVALYICAAGVGTLGIVDADTVSLSNLQRQIIHSTPDIGRLKVASAARKLSDINPNVKINSYPIMLTPANASEIVRNYDIIVDCTDSPCSRGIVSHVCENEGKPYVFGSVNRFSGLVFTHLPGTAGYSQIFTDETNEQAEPVSCAQTGILNAVVGIVGSIQAAEAIKYLFGSRELLTNRLLHIDALTMQFTTLPIE